MGDQQLQRHSLGYRISHVLGGGNGSNRRRTHRHQLFGPPPRAWRVHNHDIEVAGTGYQQSKRAARQPWALAADHTDSQFPKAFESVAFSDGLARIA